MYFVHQFIYLFIFVCFLFFYFYFFKFILFLNFTIMKFQLYYILTNAWYGQSFSNLCLGEWSELQKHQTHSSLLQISPSRAIHLSAPIFPPCFRSSSPHGGNFAVSQGSGQVSYTNIGPHSFSSLVARIS